MWSWLWHAPYRCRAIEVNCQYHAKHVCRARYIVPLRRTQCAAAGIRNRYCAGALLPQHECGKTEAKRKKSRRYKGRLPDGRLNASVGVC